MKSKKKIIDGLKFTVDMFLFDDKTGEMYPEPRNDLDKITVDACKGAIELLEHTRWIPVSERLPKDDEVVLVCNPQGGMAVAYYHFDDTYYPTQFKDLNETGWFNEEDDALYFEPIAWMPLPEPYVESEDKE